MKLNYSDETKIINKMIIDIGELKPINNELNQKIDDEKSKIELEQKFILKLKHTYKEIGEMWGNIIKNTLK